MTNEKGQNKTNKEDKKAERLKKLMGIDFCACGSINQLKCQGVCRENHTDINTGIVKCGALYQIERADLKHGGKRRVKRDWKFGRQKDSDENKQNRRDRRDKTQKDKS